jgi:hypothetical protein
MNTVNNIVNVYLFHGSQPCNNSIAVGNVIKTTVEKYFAGNSNVLFTKVIISEEANKPLVEKYRITTRTLIIAKGDNYVDITDRAYAVAIADPQALENMVKDEINKLL